MSITCFHSSGVTCFYDISSPYEAEFTINEGDAPGSQAQTQQDVENPSTAQDGRNSGEPSPDAAPQLIDVPVPPPVNDPGMDGFMDAGLTDSLDYEFEEEGIVESVDYTTDEVRGPVTFEHSNIVGCANRDKYNAHRIGIPHFQFFMGARLLKYG